MYSEKHSDILLNIVIQRPLSLLKETLCKVQHAEHPLVLKSVDRPTGWAPHRKQIYKALTGAGECSKRQITCMTFGLFMAFMISGSLCADGSAAQLCQDEGMSNARNAKNSWNGIKYWVL